MKTFVRVKADYKEQLTKGEDYELLQSLELKPFKSGKCVIIENDRGDVVGYDMDTFFE